MLPKGQRPENHVSSIWISFKFTFSCKIFSLLLQHFFHFLQQIFFYQVHTKLEFDAPTIVLIYTRVQYSSIENMSLTNLTGRNLFFYLLLFFFALIDNFCIARTTAPVKKGSIIELNLSPYGTLFFYSLLFFKELQFF